MESLFLKFAVLLNQIVQDIEALSGIGNAANQSRHGPGKGCSCKEKLLLSPAEALK